MLDHAAHRADVAPAVFDSAGFRGCDEARHSRADRGSAASAWPSNRRDQDRAPRCSRNAIHRGGCPDRAATRRTRRARDPQRAVGRGSRARAFRTPPHRSAPALADGARSRVLGVDRRSSGPPGSDHAAVRGAARRSMRDSVSQRRSPARRQRVSPGSVDPRASDAAVSRSSASLANRNLGHRGA